MKKITYQFSNKKTNYYFGADFSYLKKLTGKDSTVLITDENVLRYHQRKFNGWSVIVLNAGEETKVQRTVDAVIHQLIDLGADRKTLLIGVGGGVVTDITGYVASIYMRGINYGFVPTSVLAMVDAAIGGKNGINVGIYKNLVGSVRQPEFLLYDFNLLKTLPKQEWISGFAEIIKHACINDATMFRQLERNSLNAYKKDEKTLSTLIRRNAIIKSEIAKKDEHENGDRRLLNFGHTLGHAIENSYKLTHGEAISIGMVTACQVSEKLLGFNSTGKVMDVLSKYGLPVIAEYDKEKVFEVMKMDKKKVKNEMNYVMLERIGKGIVKTIPLSELEQLINQLQ